MAGFDELKQKAKDAAEAVKIALGLIPEGGSVAMGGAMSAHEIGLVNAVKSGNYKRIFLHNLFSILK